MQALNSQPLKETLVHRTSREPPPLSAPFVDEDASFSALSLRIDSLPEKLPELQNARLGRDLVTMLTTTSFSIDFRLSVLELLIDRFQLGKERTTAILSHSLEIAVLEDQETLASALERMTIEGTQAKTTFFKHPQHIGGGADASVYAISDYLVAKQFCSSGMARAYLGCSGDQTSDFAITRHLFLGGVSVPRPIRSPLVQIGLPSEQENPGSPSTLELCKKGLVMESIRGHCPKYPYELRDRIPYFLKAAAAFVTGTDVPRFHEIWKAWRLGFQPRDVHRGNVIFSRELGKAFLIDVSRWKLSRRLSFLHSVEPFQKDESVSA